MKRNNLLVLFVFLFFVLFFKIVNGLSSSQCSNYDTTEGVCLSGTGYSYLEIPEEMPSQPQPSTGPQQTYEIPPFISLIKPSEEVGIFFSLTIQFFSIVLLTIILIILIEELLKTL